MKNVQIFLIVGALALLGLLYFGGNTVPPPKKPAMANAQKPQENKAASLNEIEQMSSKNLDISLSNQIKSITDLSKKENLEQLSGLWAKAKQPNMSAKYKADLAKLENTEKSLTFASQYFIDLFNVEQNPNVKMWQANQAVELLDKVLVLNPNNENAKVALATCYTDGTGATMKGVLMLREVAEKNPKNLPAGIALGRLAIQSQQWNKAIPRLEKLLTLYPNNTEVMYFLAEAYKGNKEFAKAKDLFNKCKQLVKDPNFALEIDEYIKTF